MPHEKINRPDEAGHQAVVGWNRIGWVQISIYPEGWKDTGDATHVALSDSEVAKLIKTLRRARRGAYSGVKRHSGYEDRPALPSGSDLWPAQ